MASELDPLAAQS